MINVSWIAHFPWATLSDFIKHTRDWVVILMEVNFEGSCFAIHGLPYLRLNLKTIGGRCIADPISRDILIQKFCPTWDTLSIKKFERDNILQLTEKTENFTSLCTNFKDTENTLTQTYKYRVIFFKCILVILIPQWTVASVYRLLNQIKRLTRRQSRKCKCA